MKGITLKVNTFKVNCKRLFYCNQNLNNIRFRARYSDPDNWLIIGTIVTSSLQINHLIITIVFYHVFAKQWVAGWPFDIPLMYNLSLWNNFLIKKPKKITQLTSGHWEQSALLSSLIFQRSVLHYNLRVDSNIESKSLHWIIPI